MDVAICEDAIKADIKHAFHLAQNCFQHPFHHSLRVEARIEDIIKDRLLSDSPKEKIKGLREFIALSRRENRQARKGQFISLLELSTIERKILDVASVIDPKHAQLIVKALRGTQSREGVAKLTSFIDPNNSTKLSKLAAGYVEESTNMKIKGIFDIPLSARAHTAFKRALPYLIAYWGINGVFNGRGTPVTPPAHQQNVLIFVCGIDNTKDYFDGTLDAIRRVLPRDVVVAGYHNHTNILPEIFGLRNAVDVLEVFDSTVTGGHSPVMYKMSRELGAEIGQYQRTGNKVTIFAHSGGTALVTEAVRFITPQQRKNIGLIYAAPFSSPPPGPDGLRVILANSDDPMARVMPFIDRRHETNFSPPKMNGPAHYVRPGYIDQPIFKRRVLAMFKAQKVQ